MLHSESKTIYYGLNFKNIEKYNFYYVFYLSIKTLLFDHLLVFFLFINYIMSY